MNLRKAEISRKTSETDVRCELTLDGTGRAEIDTGIGFLDHLFSTLARHGRMDLVLSCTGDLQVDDHHTAEDCALVLGRALDQALGDKLGVARFGWALVPMDEALARAAIDLSGRPLAQVSLGLKRDRIGSLACENIVHVLASLATAARMTLHVEVLQGENDHHRAEAAFKAVALSLRQAIALDGTDHVPSTKGSL